MYRGYPVETLMFWETGADVGTRQIGGGDDDLRAPRLLIVDGQQRLTSLYAVMTGETRRAQCGGSGAGFFGSFNPCA